MEPNTIVYKQHKGLEALEGPPGNRIKVAAKYLWKFSQDQLWVTPAIVSYDYDDKIGACIHWGRGEIVAYILDEEIIKIEVDKSGDYREFLFPQESGDMEKFLIK
jgi:hypothetical protein